MTSNPTTKSIVITTAISFSIAVIVLIGAVLPAEFGIDPLGTGKALGLLDLYVTDTTHASSTAQTDDYVTHEIEIPLSPFESMEFKYHLATGAGMVYNWDASGEVLFDFHGEADDAEPERRVFMRAVGSAILQGHLLRLFPASTGGFGKTAAPKLSQYV